MTVFVLANCPAGLRGFLTRWLQEISPGVFLGAPSARIREILWAEIRTYSGHGRALLAYQTDNEQGFTFKTHDHSWHPTDYEGLTLIHRPSQQQRGGNTSLPPPPRQGWSKASKRRRFGNR